MKQPYLSVIISAFNEADNINRGVLDELAGYLKKQDFTWELVIVNDGSSDNTEKLLQSFAKKHPQVQVISNPHQGKALGVISGALAATGELIIFTDMDQATPMTELPKLLKPLIEGCDIVIGSRKDREGAPVFRQVLAYGMIVLRTVILCLPFKDTQCGFKLFKAMAAKEIFTLMKKFRPSVSIEGPAVDPGFDVELLYLARKLDYKVAEVPVEWHYQESRRVRFVYDAISGVTGLLLVRWRSLTGAYTVK